MCACTNSSTRYESGTWSFEDGKLILSSFEPETHERIQLKVWCSQKEPKKLVKVQTIGFTFGGDEVFDLQQFDPVEENDEVVNDLLPADDYNRLGLNDEGEDFQFWRLCNYENDENKIIELIKQHGDKGFAPRAVNAAVSTNRFAVLKYQAE